MSLLGWWVLRRPFVGLADNGDWDRYTCPLGLSGGVRFEQLPNTLVREPCLAFDYRSTFTPFLRAFAAIDTTLFGSVHLGHLALFWSVVVSLGWGWFTIELVRATGRRVLSVLTALALVAVSSDVIFTSYFGSAYAEAMVVGLLPALAAVLVRAVRVERLEPKTVAVAAFLVVLVTCAKPAMALTAPLFVGVVLVARRDRLEGPRVALGVVAALGLALFSTTTIADPEFTDWNTYNLAFTAVLPESGNARSTLVDMGVEEREADQLERFVGVPFSPEVTDAWDEPALVAFREGGRPAVVLALATNPQVWPAMVRRGGMELGDLRLDYLANHATSTPPSGAPVLAERPHPADVVLSPVAWAWWALPVSWVALLAILGDRLRRARGAPPHQRAVTALGLFAVAFAASQTLVALADGYYELAKHMVIAGEATALTIVGLGVVGVGSLLPRLRR